jgi:hypothetical protein
MGASKLVGIMPGIIEKYEKEIHDLRIETISETGVADNKLKIE